MNKYDWAYKYRTSLSRNYTGITSLGDFTSAFRRLISPRLQPIHYNDVIMSAMASQVTSLTIVYSTVYSDADQRTKQSSVSLAFLRGIHRWPVNSTHKGPVTRKKFPFDDVIMHKETITALHYRPLCWEFPTQRGDNAASVSMLSSPNAIKWFV